MPFKIDTIETDKLSVGGLQIQKPKDPREYVLSKETFENVIGSLDKGEYLLNNEYFTFPEDTLYVLSSVETYLKFQEATKNVDPSLLENKKINVNASIETYLKFWEATNGAVNYNYNSKTGFQQQLLELINDTSYFDEEVLQTKTEFTDRLLDKGIVEFGQIGEGSKLNYSEIFKKTIFNIETVTQRVSSDNSDNYLLIQLFFDRMIDLGIVVRTFKGNLIISSVETYLKFLEDVSNSPAVPA
jgi:hypothetical protein